MNYLSLFTGIGGIDLGLDRAGWTCVGQVERDPYCQRVLAKHWPEVPRHDDVRTCVEWWHSGPRPAVDAVVGGFPCQPVSVAGRQRAQADERWLWPAAWVVIRDLRPAWALLENVPGLLARGMGDVLGDLAEIGYDAEWDCVPAAAVGAPHRRDRVFVVAHPSGDPGRVQPVAEPGGCGAPVAGHDGATQPVAHAESNRWGAWGPGGPDRHGEDRSDQPASGLADTDRERQLQPPRCFADQRRRPRYSSWWDVEPDVGRVAHGIPNRVDRLRALGNAVVPQVAEHIGRLILAHAAVTA